MRRSLGITASLVLAVCFAPFLLGQKSSAPAAPAHKPANRKRYCQLGTGFCFKYPTSWNMIGEVFGGNGVVIAPPQAQDRTLWDEITVALIVPPSTDDEEPVTLDGVIEKAAASLREGGQDFETLQRQRRTVDHKPAQMLKVRYREKSTDWVEEIIFIAGPDGEVYSVALKCAPQNLARLEPALAVVLESWMLPESEPPPALDHESPAKPDSPPKAAH